MQVLEEDYYFYRLSRDEATDDHFLETTCGRSAVFTITIKLTAREITAYRDNPGSIRVLAQAIVDAPDDYFKRRI